MYQLSTGKGIVMSTSSGKSFPTNNINPGHIHYDERVNPAKAYMYKGGIATDLINNWTQIDIDVTTDITIDDIPVAVAVTSKDVSAFRIIGGDYYYTSGMNTKNSADVIALSANFLYTTPFFVGSVSTFDRIAAWITIAAAGSSMHLGIYDSNANNLPGSLVLDAGTVNTSTTLFKEINIDQELAAGLYWTCLLASANITIKGLIQYGSDGMIGFSSTNFDLVPGYFTASQAFGALPATFPSPLTNGTLKIPSIALRRSA